MSEEFKNAFDKLSINEKRNQISDELLIIGELIKNIENKYNIQSILNVKNYDANKNNGIAFMTHPFDSIYGLISIIDDNCPIVRL